MKKRELLLAVLLLCGAAVFGQKPGSIIDEVLKQSAFDKVERMRELVGFDEQQAQRLKTVEYTFLWEVRKAEGCFLCNRKNGSRSCGRDGMPSCRKYSHANSTSATMRWRATG